jgi:hypothetical protein
MNQLQEVPTKRIIDLMPAIQTRAKNPIGNFAFFATSILREISIAPATQPRGHLRRRYETFAAEVAAINIGRSEFRPSDWIAALKARCLREGLQWDDDLANQVLGL